MPAKLTVGLSRKVGEPNYGSRGASVNLEVELDSALITDPFVVQDRVRKLYTLARRGIEEELGIEPPATESPRLSTSHAGSANGREPTTLTSSQQRAIFAIARRSRLDPNHLVQSRYRLDRVEDLSIRQASELIDALKHGQTELRS
jgi:hypothetical protein